MGLLHHRWWTRPGQPAYAWRPAGQVEPWTSRWTVCGFRRLLLAEEDAPGIRETRILADPSPSTSQSGVPSGAPMACGGKPVLSCCAAVGIASTCSIRARSSPTVAVSPSSNSSMPDGPCTRTSGMPRLPPPRLLAYRRRFIILFKKIGLRDDET
eukprot:scaffold34563_cov30-Tisochrysis_lutea.AAC.1